ncbi:NRPS [Sporothrix epigloea]|uniref:NRPS n=1 Tax=Sporothrix epigloea TaxID=1892477 RepID=A0ABP0DQ48_9PEZI
MDEQQLSILNPEARKLPGPELLHLLVFGSVADGGGNDDSQTPALDYRGPDGSHTTLLYPELHRIAGVLAAKICQCLQQLPVLYPASASKELVVPVLIPQAPELYVSLLGILKAGGAFCPIQLDAPPDRIRFILGDVAADVILTTSALVAKIPVELFENLQVILVDQLHLFDGPNDQQTPSFVPRSVGADDLAYVMYTSGSTGTPKGVGIPHGAATQSLLAHDRHVPQFQRFLQFAAPTFDVSVFEIFFPWFRQATLVCCSRAEMLDDLPSVIRSLRVDACELTPTVAGSLLQARANAPGLRLLLTIGEMLTEPVIREFGHGPEHESILWAMYGPTEAAIHCTLQPSLDGTASVKNIGFPLDTVSAYILAIPDDESSQSASESPSEPRIVQLGEVGELAVGGHQLARGYINRPEQTAAAFIDTKKYGRLYRTGDKARITEQGTLECFGRLSGGQVKLRGQRIELGEVEQAVLRTDGCLGCVAAIIGGILVAFCDLGPKGFTDAPLNGMEEAIIASCQSWLPRFMIPGNAVLMAEFPRLASGKVDRKRLASDYENSSTQNMAIGSNNIEYKDELDRQLHEIAHEILNSSIDCETPLAAAGLDSLKAIRFAAAIRECVKVQASAVDVLEARSVSTLHTRLKSLAVGSSALPEMSQPDHVLDSYAVFSVKSSLHGLLDLQDVELVAECSPTQAAMLTETLADPNAYCNWIEFEFAREYQPDAIALAFQTLIDLNEALRAGFVHYDGRFVQVIRRAHMKSQVQKAPNVERSFQLDSETALLHPFAVQIDDNSTTHTGPTRAVLYIHHAVYDGWSIDLMRRDLDAILKGETPEKRLCYSAVVQSLRSISAKDKGAAEQFWADSLYAFQASPVPELNPRRDLTGKVLIKIESLSTAKGDIFAKERIDRAAGLVGCSTQVIFQAALAWLWSGLIGSPDVVFGTVASGRTLPLGGVETVIGPCLQTVPLRTDLSRMQTIRDLLQSLHISNRLLLPHAFLPLTEIKKTAGIRPGQPLYDVLFVYQESLFSQSRPDDAVVEIARQDYLETKLLWEVEPVFPPGGPSHGQFRVRTTFYADAFPERQVDLLMRQFSLVVDHIVNHIDDTIASVTAAMPPALQSRYNIDYRSFDGCPDLATFVKNTARRTPNRAAICFATSLHDGVDGGDGNLECTSLSYDELHRMTNRIARCLRANLNVRTGDAIAIVMEKSIFLYAGILGILKAGCAYLPLLPSTPTARTYSILKQSGVQVVLSDTATTEALTASTDGRAIFDLQTADLSCFSDAEYNDAESIPVDPARIANIVYTSGSTGVPKGVCVTQLNICSNLDVLSRIYPDVTESGGRLLQSCSQAFDVSVFEIFYSWVYGLCVCSATNDVMFADLERVIRLFGITHLSMTPTVAAIVNPQTTPSVEFLVTAGEPLTDRVATTWSKQLFQGYGPSETTNICTVKKMKKGDTIRHLGFAFENTSTVVLPFRGDKSNPVPRGAVGEFCFGGDQVVAGYLDLPTLTDEKFFQHPTFGRLYRSGDVGRMLPDGSLMITGRIDDQIKLRGQRIELNEINTVLCASPILSEAFTLVVRREGAEQLASFFVPAPTTQPQGSSFCVFNLNEQLLCSLFSDLHSRLPIYMVPTFLIPIAAVPLTPSGKVNRALLLETFQHFSQDQLSAFANKIGSVGLGLSEDGADWTDLELRVCSVVCSVLTADTKSASRWTPLASLGLDSLSAILVARRLSTTTSRLTISDVLRNASIAQLARLLLEKANDTVEATAAPTTSNAFSSEFTSQLKKRISDHGLTSTSPVLPCMPLQEAMLVSPTRGKSYVNSMLFRLTGDVVAVQEAWEEMRARHAILRTCFVTTDHDLYPTAQIALDSCTTSWSELTASPEITVHDLAQHHRQSLPSPLDSFQPPVSFAIITEGHTTYLSFVCHHALYDGEAMGRLLWEVEQLVTARREQLLPNLGTTAKFDTFLEHALRLPKSTDAFWNEHLSGFKPAILHPATNVSSKTDMTSSILTKSLDTPFTAIQDKVQKSGISLLTACQAPWACVTGILLQSKDVCFGNVYSGRSVLVNDVDRLVAPCFNTLPVRANLANPPSNRDLLSYFQALNPEMITHQFTPLRQIQRQHSGGKRLFDSLLLLQPPSRPLDASIWTLEQDDGEMDLPIVCELIPDETQNNIKIHLHFDKQILTSDGAEVLMDLFNFILTTLLQFSSSRLPERGDLPKSLQDRLEKLQLEIERVADEEDPTSSEIDSDNSLSESWTPSESIIRSVLSQLSGVPEAHIRRDTTIYRLGLDSVRAVQVASLLRKQGLQISAVDVMEFPTCKGLAELLSPTPVSDMIAAANSAPTSSDPPTPATTLAHTSLSTAPSISLSGLSEHEARKESRLFDFGKFQKAAQSVLDKNRFYANNDVETILPCTPLQSGLLTEFKQSHGSHYFNFISFQRRSDSSREQFDGRAWASAWKDAAASIPMLRTGFISMENADDNDFDEDAPAAFSPFAIVQVSSNIVDQNVLLIDLEKGTAFDYNKWKTDATEKALTELHCPPWQVVIVEDGHELTCYLAIHHALYDAASLHAILDTVMGLIKGNVTTASGLQTGAVVSDILHQVSWLTCETSSLVRLWEKKAAQTVVNTFPILTPLKESPGQFGVLSRQSSQTFSSLQESVQSAGFTLHAVLQAAWTRILSSYLGDTSVIFGVVLSGRNTDETRKAIFPCISTLPMIAQNKASNRELVEKMMEMGILLHKSQHVPLRQIQQWLGQPGSRLFDTLLVYQNATSGLDADQSYPWTVVEEQATVNYPVSIEAIKSTPDQPLAYQITYDTGVLPTEHAAILLQQLDTILGHIASCPDGSESDLASLHPDIYSMLPPSVPEMPSEIKLLHEFVEKQAEERPAKTALQFVTAFDEHSANAPIAKEWSFRELNMRGNQVAKLISQYAEPGSIVSICFDKCPEAFFAMLGILKAGCAYLALDIGAPAARKDFILQDAGVKVLLTDTLRAQQPASSDGLLNISADVQVIPISESLLMSEASSFDDGRHFVSQNRRATVPSDVCYCLYTSGTTGTPKGCAITHENAVQCMLAFQELFHDHHDPNTSRWLQFASFHFDVAVVEQYWTWSVGMTLVSAPQDLILEDLAGTISRLGITHIDLTPSLGRLLDPKDVPSLCRGVFITGGEPLKQEMLDAWGPTGAVHNFYGPTEATIGVTSYPQVPQNGRASNIGRQFSNVGTLVFEPGTQTPVLRGGVGELCVSGKLVGQGYLNRVELTNERFPELVDELGHNNRKNYGQRIYRTGDLVRMMHDGCFDFLGRADDQVKLRGQRLEIGEINHAIRLGLGSSVGDVATLIIRDEDSKKDFLVSFVVVGDESGTHFKADAQIAQKVQSACRERLPGYMVPTYVVRLESIPLSPNNKAEAKELKRIFNSLTSDERMRTTGAVGAIAEGASIFTNATSAAPTASIFESPTGQAVIRALHKLSLIGPDDKSIAAHMSIFELGIDSVSVLRFARALKRAGLSSATPSILLTYPKLGDLVAALDVTDKPEGADPQQTIHIGSVLEARFLVDACQHRNRTHVCQALEVGSDEIEYIAPCSALQQGIISRARSGSEHTNTYYNAFLFELYSETDVQRLHDAWTMVQANNAVLRTRFALSKEGFIQVALKISSSPLPWIQLDLEDDEKFDLVLQQHYKDWVDANQDVLIAKPWQLLSVTWRQTTTCVLHIFHGLYDAASLNMILEEVADVYNRVPPSSISIKPTFLDALVHGPLRNYGQSRAFWEKHLEGCSAIQPVPSLVGPDTRLDHQDVGVGRELTFAMADDLCVQLGVTHASLIQALWVSVLQGAIFGVNSCVSIGLVLSGRSMEDLDQAEGVVGPLFNTLPFFVPAKDPSTPALSWAGLAKLCSSFSINTLPFQQTPLRDIQKWCSSGQPLFDVLFSFQYGDEATRSKSSLALWNQTETAVNADYPLALEAVLGGPSSPSTLRLFLVAKAQTADEKALNRLLDHFEDALQAVGADPFASILGGASANMCLATKPSSAKSVNEETAILSQTQNRPSFEWNDTALAIRKAMATVAGVPSEDILETNTLLELGLDSVDTIKLSARLREAGIRLTNSQLVRGKTITSFMSVIDEEAASAGDKPSNGKVQGGAATTGELSLADTSFALVENLRRSGHDLSNITHVLPPTPLQDAMVADMIASDFQLYFNHDILELASNTDTRLLKAAWEAMIAKHAVLRTGFFSIDSPEFDMAYCQAIFKTVDCITEHTLSSEEMLDDFADSIRNVAKQGQEISGLFHLSFVSIQNVQRLYLVLSMSHALYDGWSLDLLHRAVEAEYARLEGLALSAKNGESAYTKQLARILQSCGPQTDQFWQGFLDGATPTNIHRAEETANGLLSERKTVVRQDSVSTVAAADLRDFCKRQAVSTQVVGQACWAAVLSTLTKSLDVLFGVVLSGRDDVEGEEEALFPTLNTVPIRVVLHGTTAELLQYMQGNMSIIGEHQHYPLRKAQRFVSRAGGDEPGIFNTLFILQKRPPQEHRIVEGTRLMKSVGGASDVEYPVCVEMEVVQSHDSELDKIIWRVACDSAYVSEAGAARLLEKLDTVLQIIVRTAAHGNMLTFDDNKVSVCGLSSFSPNMPARNGVYDSKTQLEDKVNDTDASVWTEDELAIRSVLSTAAGLPESDIQRTGQTLYHLGLDSISAIKVSNILKKTRGIFLGVRAMLAANSVQEMAVMAASNKEEEQARLRRPEDQAGISNALALANADHVVQEAGILPIDVERVLPATAMQVHMVSVWQNTTGDVFFPVFRYRLSTDHELSLEDIHACWSQLVADHPILRTIFLSTGSDEAIPLLQVVLHAKPPSVWTSTVTPCVWPSLGDGSLHTSLAVLTVTSEIGVDGKTAFSVALKIHHALYDAVSLQTLLDRFEALLQSPVTKLSKSLSSAWEQLLSRQFLVSTTENNKQFWTQYLAGANIVKVQDDNTQQLGRASYFLPSALDRVTPLKDMAVQLGIGLPNLAFAIYAKMLANGTGSDKDVIFGIYLANRGQDGDGDDELAAYPMLCLVPLLIRSPAQREIADIAAQVQADIHTMSANGSLTMAAPLSASLWEIQQWTGITVDSFVNFLLPGDVSTTGASGAPSKTITLEHINESTHAEINKLPTSLPSSFPALQNNCARSAYKDVVDIEMAVRDNGLDIGVFGSNARLGDDDGAKARAEELVAALRREVSINGPL